MEIIVNQETYAVSDNCSLEHLFDFILQPQTQGIAIAVNQEIISRNDWKVYQLQPGDKITIIKATQGG